MDQNEEEYEVPAGRLCHERLWLNLRSRWVQAALVAGAWALVAGLSAFLLAPSSAPKKKRQLAANTDDFQFVHCPKCQYETRYSIQLVGEDCPKCREEPVGKLVGSHTSILARKADSGPSPWRLFYMALALESLVAVGGIVLLLYRPVPDPASVYYVFNCPHCNQRLRFRQTALGGIGQCSRCKRPVRFPDEEGAVLESKLDREERARREAIEEQEEDDDEEYEEG